MIALKICFLVDGLDEFDGDYEEIATLFKEVASAPGIKACLSSRPWVVFDDIFKGCPTLQLQDLTYGDIKHYVTDKMRRNNAFRRLEEEEPQAAPALIQEIVERAKGVFIWVKLVVQSLLNGLRNQDEISDLWERLKLLPEEMEPLYNRLLQLVERVYLPWVSRALQLVRNVQDLSVDPFRTSCKLIPGVKPLSISAFLLAMNPDTDLAKLYRADENKFFAKCKRTEVQLKARCAGFLELSKTEANTMTGEDYHIQYFHRTARDFLETKASCSNLLLHTVSTGFHLNISLMRSCLDSLQIVLARLRNYQGISYVACEEGVIDGLVKDFMVYAYHAETSGEDKNTRIELVDQMSNIMATHSENYRQGVSQWIANILPGMGTLGFKFMDFAMLYGQECYVREKLQQYDKSQVQSIATGLLGHLLPSNYQSVKFGLPLPSIEMVSMLLDHIVASIDKEEILRSLQRPWGNLILCMNHISMTDLTPSPVSGDDYDFHGLYLRYLDIMKILVLACNRTGCIRPGPVHAGRGSITSIDLVERFVAENYPQYASTLLPKLRFLESAKLDGDRKRYRVSGPEDFDSLERPKKAARGSDGRASNQV